MQGHSTCLDHVGTTRHTSWRLLPHGLYLTLLLAHALYLTLLLPHACLLLLCSVATCLTGLHLLLSQHLWSN